MGINQFNRKDKMTTLKNRLSTSKIPALLVEDIKKYGVEGGSYSDKNFEHSFLLIKIPSVPAVNQGGEKVKVKPQIAYYDLTTREMGIGQASDFFALLETLPTLDKVIKWKERETNLSEEERALVLASIEHEARIVGRRYNQEEKEQAFGFLIKNEPLLKHAIENERKYQSLSRIERTMIDRIEKEKVAKKSQCENEINKVK